ncbi:MAG: hypothetical protein IPJ30_15205 [Acidobacteria bacterium]|nr:hypothetical protein [Acidobacteriota bacterium]MBK8148773.1 hypothetical protein [Acidobacteriota bacterium]
MGIIWEYLRNPATFKRRQAIGCLGGCIGTPMILGFMLVLFWAIDSGIIDRKGLGLLVVAGVTGFFVIMLLFLGFWLRSQYRR